MFILVVIYNIIKLRSGLIRFELGLGKKKPSQWKECRLSKKEVAFVLLDRQGRTVVIIV